MFLSLSMKILLIAALLPAAVLLFYIFKQDKIEKEPTSLLIKLLIMGVLSCIPAVIWELVGESVLSMIIPPETQLYSILSAFLVVAAAEEGCKFFFLKKCTWKHPAFNYMFDAIVYSVFVSLGFAGLENILYVFQYGLGTAFTRAFLSVPGHMAFAIFMGIYYGRARLCENYQDYVGRKKNLRKGYLLAVLIHGFYDACLFVSTAFTVFLFVVFVIAMYIITFRTIKKASREDHSIEVIKSLEE